MAPSTLVGDILDGFFLRWLPVIPPAQQDEFLACGAALVVNVLHAWEELAAPEPMDVRQAFLDLIKEDVPA